MDYRDIYRLVRKHLVASIMLICIGLGGSAYVTSQTKKIYEAKSTIFVATPPSLLDTTGGGSKIGELTTGNAFSQARVKSYAQIISSPDTLIPVISELKLNMTPGDLASKVSAISYTDTVLLEITVHDQSPTRAADIANSVANHFAITVQQIELNSNQNLSSLIKVSVVRQAKPNFTPIAPRKIFNYLLGVFIGGVFALLYLLIRKSLDNTVKTEDDLKPTSLFGVVAYDGKAVEFPLISMLDPYAPRTEAYRVVRTNILHFLEKAARNDFFISSCFVGEGKSTGSINTALAISQAGFRVLVVEADMRRPSFKKYGEELGVDFERSSTQNQGLSYLLASPSTKLTSRNLSTQIVTTRHENFYLLPSGEEPDNPAELLGSQRFVEISQLFANSFDFVIYDTPPILAVADATIIARVIPNGVLMCHAGKTMLSSLFAAKAALKEVDCELTGAILNKVPKPKAGEAYGYTYSGRADIYRYSYNYSSTLKENKDARIAFSQRFKSLKSKMRRPAIQIRSSIERDVNNSKSTPDFDIDKWWDEKMGK